MNRKQMEASPVCGNSVVVRLDNSRFGAGPGTVIGHVSTVAEFLAKYTDRDGCRYPEFRMWAGNYPVGTRVSARQ